MIGDLIVPVNTTLVVFLGGFFMYNHLELCTTKNQRIVSRGVVPPFRMGGGKIRGVCPYSTLSRNAEHVGAWFPRPIP